MIEDKIKTLEELGEIVKNLRKEGKKIVLCHGCFDLLHYGHIRHFISSKQQGDVLIVTISPDEFVKKGPGRPFFNQDIRLKQVASLEFVDYVALNRWETAVETIKMLKPDIYSKGKEVLDNKSIDQILGPSAPQSNLSAEVECLEALGGKLYLTDDITFSSSKIINQITAEIPEETKKFLNNFKQKFKAEEILEILKSLENIRVLAIGDAILDEYIYCKPMGMTGKESLIAYKFLESQPQLGGIFALANNLANFTNNASILTCVGNNTYEFVNNFLNKKVEANVFIQPDMKTLTKTRYINEYRKLKIFEVYNTDGFKINQENEKKLLDYLDKNLSRFDFVIMADYGHGLISQNVRDYLTASNKFLAVYCQFNAGNLGYNFITKYKRADFVFMNDNALRLPFQDKKTNIEIPIKKLQEHLRANKINITLGKYGAIYYQDKEFYRVNSLTYNVVDTMGVDEAILALTSLLTYKGAEPALVPFLGNCIGALAVKIMGNTKTPDPIELKKFISYLMK
jgi:cytidyltransferase-like protein